MKLGGLLALAWAATACAAAARPAPMVLQPGQIDLARGPDGNTEILDAPQGLIVVDTGRHPEHARAILDHARRAGKPIVAIVNTHWHLDHTTGDREILTAFPNAQIVASRAVESALAGFLKDELARSEATLAAGNMPADARARVERSIAAVRDRAALVPTLPVERDQVLALGGRKLEVHLARAAATEGDVWLVVPDEKLAIVGDLVVGAVPFFDTGCEQGWAAALAAIDAARWDRLVPGHGAVMTRVEFRRWRGAFAAYLDCARSARSAQDCAEQWTDDARGFYSAGEAPQVPAMARYYIENVLRAPPAKRMAYCRKSP